jgi:hypothetical protein
LGTDMVVGAARGAPMLGNLLGALVAGRML